MPQMGVSVSEGTVTKWLKNVGDTIEADEPLLEISTDKVDTEVPAPGNGVLSEILVAEGETVEVGTVLARIGGEAGSAPTAQTPEPPPKATPSSPLWLRGSPLSTGSTPGRLRGPAAAAASPRRTSWASSSRMRR